MDSDAITQFVSVTGADAQQAAHFLEASKGDLNAAVAAFFATQEAGPSGPSSTTTAGRSPSPAVPVETPRPTPRYASPAVVSLRSLTRANEMSHLTVCSQDRHVCVYSQLVRQGQEHVLCWWRKVGCCRPRPSRGWKASNVSG